MPVIKSLADLGEAVIKASEDYRHRAAEVVYDNLTKNKNTSGIGTPVKTGTLRANWQAAPGNTGGDGFIKNTGESRAKPARFDTSKYLRNWSVFTIKNNSPYVIHVNDGISGNSHNANFIGKALAQAEVEMEGYIEKRS